jgi:pimeloyl-ACP methyl ester carboxylesterase
MATYVDLDGVRTWYDERGAGAPLVLLHPGGAGVDSRAFGPNLSALAARFQTFTPERRAHGHTPDVEGPITFEAMAQDTIHFLEQVIRGPARYWGSATARRSRSLSRSAGPTSSNGWCSSPASFTTTAGGPR